MLLLLLLLRDIPGGWGLMETVEALVLLLQVAPCILPASGVGHRQPLGSSQRISGRIWP